MPETAAPSSRLAMLVQAPIRISVSADLSVLELGFADGGTVRLNAERLRGACKCAHCLRARIDGVFPASFSGIAITEVAPIGGYAINIGFSDGHARGIYPWNLLVGLEDPATAAA
jgi:prepilin-type processing-associated H-X9-DG protein